MRQARARTRRMLRATREDLQTRQKPYKMIRRVEPQQNGWGGPGIQQLTRRKCQYYKYNRAETTQHTY